MPCWWPVHGAISPGASGAWPQTLADLVPGYLASIPPDRFTGKPLSYRLADGAPVVYSWGMDQQDDDGDPAIIRMEEEPLPFEPPEENPLPERVGGVTPNCSPR